VVKLTSLLLLAAVTSTLAADRRNFDGDWKFHLGDLPGSEQPAADDNAWRAVHLPHDWSIEGPYAATNASGTGFLPGGIGWYRKNFTIPESLRGSRIFIAFDGVYRDSDVWINGQLLGHRPYGYSSFEYDLTRALKFGDERNVIAVRVDHSTVADSRFYTGSGIYRHVWLVVAPPVHAAHWGVFVRTPIVTPERALVSIETEIVNQSDADSVVQVATSIHDNAGHEIGSVSTDAGKIAAGATRHVMQQVAVPNPKLWSLDSPSLYTAITRIGPDETRTPFGIRTIRFDANHGFFLNGQPLKLKGVCLHHDLGGLGAAFSEAALERRLKILKDLGVNAIRCSHNPMAPEEYDLCDRLGLLVMDEAFDEWTGGKHKWIQGWNAGQPGTRGYHEVFPEWSDRDLTDMVLRDRNHPSIVLWSIGNEIDYPGDPFGHPMGARYNPGMRDANELVPIARRLLSTVKLLDATRPVTQALADSLASNATGLSDVLDVAGYNYLEQHYPTDHRTYPDRIILGSENSHSAAAWRAVAENDYVAGQFLWTGIDYLGESVRYPDRGNAAGLLDLCAFRKPMSYYREALWSDKPMVYVAAHETASGRGPANRPGALAEHWNWPKTRATVPVDVYTNCPSAELFLNGKSLGAKPVADRLDPVLHWDVPNEPGILRAVGMRDSQELARFELGTAAGPHRLRLVADRSELAADGEDVANIEVDVLDAEGRRVYLADTAIGVTVSGAGSLAAVDTGDLRDTAPVQSGHRKVYQGRALAIVRAGTGAGAITVRAAAAGLQTATINLAVK